MKRQWTTQNSQKVMNFMLLLAFSFSAVSCANKVRTTNTGRDATTVVQMLETSNSLSTTSATATNQSVSQIYNTPGSKVYFAESSIENRNMGPLEVVASLDFEGLGITDYIDNSSSLKAYFISTPSSSGTGALVIQYMGANSGGEKEITFVGGFNGERATIQNGTYNINLFSADGTKVIQAVIDDLNKDSSDLADVIQLRLYDVTNGNSIPLGKITTMQGYQLQ